MSQCSLAGRGERDALAVGRPGRARVLVVAVGDLLRLGRAVGRDDVEVTAPVARPADAVELELEPREPPRCALLLVLLLVRLVRHARREDDPGSVRRPDRLADVLLQVGEALRLAAAGRQHVELAVRLLVVTSLRDEREPVAVRRPARLRVVLAGREPARRRRAVRAREPDRLAVLVLVAVDRPDDVRDLLAARAQPGVGDPRELVDVLGPHPHVPKVIAGRFGRCESSSIGAGGVGAAAAAVAQRREFFERLVLADVDASRAAGRRRADRRSALRRRRRRRVRSGLDRRARAGRAGRRDPERGRSALQPADLPGRLRRRLHVPRHGDDALEPHPSGRTRRPASSSATRSSPRPSAGRKPACSRSSASASSPASPTSSRGSPPTSSSPRSTRSASATAPTSSSTATTSRRRSRSGPRSRSA